MNNQVFSSDPLFTAAVDKAFRTVVNDTQTNPSANGPETLARYCDMMMRKNAGKKDVASSTTLDSNGKKKGNLRRPDNIEDSMDPEEKLLKMVKKKSFFKRDDHM